MMNKKWLPHTITVAAFLLFVFLGLACESTPSSTTSYTSYSSSSGEYSYTARNESSVYINVFTDSSYSKFITVSPGSSVSFKSDMSSLDNMLWQDISRTTYAEVEGNTLVIYNKY
jgi:hypothetical protein